VPKLESRRKRRLSVSPRGLRQPDFDRANLNYKRTRDKKSIRIASPGAPTSQELAMRIICNAAPATTNARLTLGFLRVEYEWP